MLTRRQFGAAIALSLCIGFAVPAAAADNLVVFAAASLKNALDAVTGAWQAETGAAQELLNPLGGAIALGHPLGASGAVLMTRMIHHMRDNGIRYGLQTMCEGGGTANATIVELVG